MTRSSLIRTLLAVLAAASAPACAGAPPPQPTITLARPAGDTSSLTVSIRHQANRRLQAVLADVERIAVEVANGETAVRFLDRAAITQGQASVTFDRVRRGSVVVTVQAMDADGKVIGVGRQGAHLADTPVDIAVSLQLDATYLASPAPATGDLDTGISFQELPTVGTVSTLAGSATSEVVADSANQFWVLRGSTMAKLRPDGSEITTVPVTQASNQHLMVDGQDNVWLYNRSNTLKYSAGGQLLTTLPVYAPTMAVDASGKAWLAQHHSLLHLDANGVQVATTDLGDTISAMVYDDVRQTLWVRVYKTGADPAFTNELLRCTPDGTVLGRTPLRNSTALALAPSGHVWTTEHLFMTNGEKTDLLKIAPDGQIVGRFAAGINPEAIRFDAAGNAWVIHGSFNANNLWKLSPEGTPLGVNSLGKHSLSTVAAGGHLWVAAPNGLIKVTP